MATAKVVRVEDVLEGPQDVDTTSQMQLLVSRAADGEQKSTAESSLRAVESQDGLLEAEEAAEAKDKVYPLPDNWPRIEQLKRPMSCSLSTSRMPCVRKAVSHMELIQNIIDEWFKRTVEEIRSRCSTQSSSHSVQVAPKKQLRFHDPSTRSTTRSAVSTVSKTSSQASSTPLSVTGVGVDTPESPPEEEVVEDVGLEIPYLGAEDVIDEVITLLARLETDRQDTQNRFQQEITTAATLKTKIDELCLRRLRELPVLVQREHEACIMDLNELQWHVAYTSRTLTKAQQRKDGAEVMNNRLKEDIDFVKMHVPLVEEKLVLELEAMDRIKKAQVETNQELMSTKQRQAKTEQKSTEAMTKAETERGHIRRELDSVRDNLTQISEALSEAKMTFNSYVHQVNDIGNQLTDNSQELKVLEVKDTNAKSAEEMQATKVRALQAKITEAEFEYRRLENENIQAEEELKVMKARNASHQAQLEQKARALEGKLRTIVRRNEELSIDIEDTQEKINKCDQQKVADDKNIRRIQREMERVATMMQATMEEHMSVSTINHHIRDQLHSEQEKAFRTEESLKNTAETLRRQVKEEIHTRTVLQARINSDNQEIEKTRSESAKKKEKADKVASDVGSAVNNVLEKVEKLRAAKEKKDQLKVDLTSQIEETEKQHTESLKQFEDRLSTIMPHYNHLKEQQDKLLEEERNLHDLIDASLEEGKRLADEHGVKCYARMERKRLREAKQKLLEEKRKFREEEEKLREEKKLREEQKLKGKHKLRGKEQKLGGKGQKLTAEEQRLKEGGQELTAEEQRLKEGGQKLTVEEQRLKEGGQKLTAEEQRLKEGGGRLGGEEQKTRKDEHKPKQGEQKPHRGEQKPHRGEQKLKQEQQKLREGGQKQRVKAASPAKFRSDGHQSKLGDELARQQGTTHSDSNITSKKHAPPIVLRLTDEVGHVDKQLDHINWKSDMMNKKIEEMDGAQAMMSKVLTKTEAAVAGLMEEQEELTTQYETVHKIAEDLKRQLAEVEDRLNDGVTNQFKFLQDRNAVLKKQEDDKVKNLKRNQELASRYRQLQNEYLFMKEKLLRSFDERLKLEATITDIKQLKSLQSKMHGALTEFFKLNGLYNEGELTRLEQVSSENGLRVGQLQMDMEEALGLITHFLQTEMDGTRAREMAWEAVKKMEEQKKNGTALRPDSSMVLAS